MSTNTLKGHVVPTSSDQLDVETAFREFGGSISDLPPANSVTAANQIAAMPGTTFPVHVWRTDLHAHHVLETPGGEWMQSGGQDFFAEAEVGRTVANNATAELHVDAFKNRSEGWAISGGGIVIPQTGVWALDIYGNLAGVSSTTAGRRFFDLKIGSNVHNQKFHIPDDSSGGGSTSKYIEKGEVVWFRVRNETGASRVASASITLAYIGLPRLV